MKKASESKEELELFFKPMLCPAMRAKMGDRWYYVATMTFEEIARCVQPVDKIHEKKELKTWIQRELKPQRTEQIAQYLITQSQRFFNALVLGIYGGEPEWQPIEIQERLKIRGMELDERQENAFGMIHLSGVESIFAIDGQHRVEGIRSAVRGDKGKGLVGEEQTVILVAHKVSEEGRKRTRRLFSTLNTYAQATNEREIVAISEDNGFAIATRRLIEEYPGLNISFAPLLGSANIPQGNPVCITTAVGLYHLTKVLAGPEIRKRKKAISIGPVSPPTVDSIYNSSVAFWDALKKHIPAIKEVCGSQPDEEKAKKYRRPDGGNLLFRSAGMTAFAGATRVLIDRGETADSAVQKLKKIPLELDDKLWQEVLWRPENETMLHKYTRLAQNVMLSQIKANPEPRSYSVTAKYKEITGRPYSV